MEGTECWVTVTLAHRTDKYAAPDVSNIPDAVGITGRQRYGPPAAEVTAAMLSAIAPNYYYLDDRRSQDNWGATSPDIQALIIGVGANVITVPILYAIRGVAAKIRNTNVPHGAPAPEPLAEHVWNAFTDFAERAFCVKSMRCIDIEKTDRYWYLTADCDGRRIEAKMSLDALIVIARWQSQSDEGELPDPDQA